MTTLLKAHVWFGDAVGKHSSRKQEVEFKFVKQRRAWKSTHEVVLRPTKRATMMFVGLPDKRMPGPIGEFRLPFPVDKLIEARFAKGEVQVQGDIACLLHYFLNIKGKKAA